MNNGQQRWWNGWPQRRWFCHRDYIVTNFGPCHSVFFRNPKKCHLASGFVPKIGCLNMDVQLLTLANSPFVCSKIWYRMVPRKYSAWRTMVFPLMISCFFLGHLIGRCSRLQVFGVLPTEGGWKERCHSKILTVWGPFEISHRGGNLGPSRCFASALRISGRWGWSKVKQWGSKRIIS